MYLYFYQDDINLYIILGIIRFWIIAFQQNWTVIYVYKKNLCVCIFNQNYWSSQTLNSNKLHCLNYL